MLRAESGLVILYSYLWAREHDRGEDAGRKDRPACVQILFGSQGARLALLFPITSQPPLIDASALAIPHTEARRVGLRLPAWVVVNEWNEDDLTVSPFVAAPAPLGSFSRAFCQEIRHAAVAAITARQHRRISR